jgi:hypothetical protein
MDLGFGPSLAGDVMTSTTLETDSWSSASPMVTLTTVSPINSDFELVQVDLNTPATSRFFRVEVNLSE